MNWIDLCKEDQLTEIKKLSHTKAQVIFKHSTRCSVSSLAKNRLERNDQPANIDFYLLDLIKYRLLSDKIAVDFEVYHESPQVLLIRDSNCTYEESHHGIHMDEIIEQVQLN